MNIDTGTARRSTVSRRTTETSIKASVVLDGAGASDITTGIGFLDHMLTLLSFHSRMNIELTCAGDLQVDDHHTAEDCAIVIGQAMREALGDRAGIARYGTAYAPMDESLARCVADLSGRPAPVIELGLTRERLGELACENITHFLHTLAMELRCALHIDVLRGDNDHHRAEAAFKALAMALRQAILRTGDRAQIPSTKGVLE